MMSIIFLEHYLSNPSLKILTKSSNIYVPIIKNISTEHVFEIYWTHCKVSENHGYSS